MDRAGLDRMRELTLGLTATDERLMRLRSRAERVTTMLDGLPHGSMKRSIIEEAMVRIASELERVTATYEELNGLRAEFEVQLQKCGLKVREREVMRLRYEDGLSWNRIGAMMGLTDGGLFKLHRRAVKKFYREEGSKRQ